MRKVIVNVALSLDGKIEGPKGEYDWCFADQDYGMNAFVNRVDAVFYGRKSYEVMMKEGNGKNPFGSLKSYVFSSSLPESKDYVLLKGDIKSAVPSLLDEAGKDIWLFGGAELINSFLEAGLVDELQLAIHPVVLGGGKSLFSNLSGRMKTELITVKSYDTGLLIASYQVVKEKS